MTSTDHNIQELLSTVRTLRSSQGCPWDRRQTLPSLMKYFHEELRELMEAIENEDYPNICEESGDLLYLILMISEMSREKNKFQFSDIVRMINQKLLRRHPHVFAGQSYENEEELNRQWQQIKKEEKKKNLFDTNLPKQ